LWGEGAQEVTRGRGLLRKSRGKWRLRLVFKDFRKKDFSRTDARSGDGPGSRNSLAMRASFGSPVAELPSLVARYASYQGRSSATGPSRATRSSLRARTQGLPFPARDSTLATRRRPHAGRVGNGRQATGNASRWSAIPRRLPPSAAPGGCASLRSAITHPPGAERPASHPPP